MEYFLILFKDSFSFFNANNCFLFCEQHCSELQWWKYAYSRSLFKFIWKNILTANKLKQDIFSLKIKLESIMTQTFMKIKNAIEKINCLYTYRLVLDSSFRDSKIFILDRYNMMENLNFMFNFKYEQHWAIEFQKKTQLIFFKCLMMLAKLFEKLFSEKFIKLFNHYKNVLFNCTKELWNKVCTLHFCKTTA